MDGLSNKIEFKYSELKSEVDDPNEDWQLLLRVTANFTIEVAGQTFFDEKDFPVVEFAEQANKWAAGGGNFSYVSMETDENPMISFNMISEETLLISAVDSEREIDEPLDAEIVRHALSNFITRLSNDVRDDLRIDINAII